MSSQVASNTSGAVAKALGIAAAEGAICDPITPLTIDLQHRTTPMLSSHDAVRIALLQLDSDADERLVLCDTTSGTETGSLPRVLLSPMFFQRTPAGAIDDIERTVEWPLGFEQHGTPVQWGSDRGDRILSAFATARQLAFDATCASWSAVGGLVGERFAAPTRSEAYDAFSDLAGWLQRTTDETAELVGVGRTTPYAWQRDGREPQARSARRLFETHALVRQLVLALGETEARAALARGGAESALALIKSGRVAEAEAQFADVIYGHPPTAQATIGASRAGDEDVENEQALPTRQTGGRRRVHVRRGR